MATSVYFNNKNRTLPGAYSTIVSGEQNIPANLDYGRVLIIDTGAGAGWGGGGGSNGTLASGKNAVYSFTNMDDFRAYVKGGIMWKLAEPLFKPWPGANGISTLFYVRAAATTPAVMDFTVTQAGRGGTFKIKTKDEGVVANGVLTSSHLDKGYAFTVTPGKLDITKFIFNVWLGGWKGDHTDGLAYDEVSKATSKAKLVISSPEFTNIQTLIDWAITDTAFGKLFSIDPTSAVVGTGVIQAGDTTAFLTYTLASGGTETYGSTDLDKALLAVEELDYQFLLSDELTPADYSTTPTTTLVAHINDPNTAFIKTLVFSGGAAEANFDASVAMAVAMNSNRIIATHGNVKTTTRLLATGFRTWPTIYTSAVVLGRMCGLAPQIPVTNKQISVDGVVHDLTKREQEIALNAGLVVVVNDQFRGGFKVLQGVNTLQDNKHLFNALGQSFSTQFERITAQINRELIVNSERDLLSQENGVNANTLSPGLLTSWTETYLYSRVAKPEAGADNLLLSFRDVSVTKVDDYYKVTYGIVVNNEITKIFYTGFLFKS